MHGLMLKSGMTPSDSLVNLLTNLDWCSRDSYIGPIGISRFFMKFHIWLFIRARSWLFYLLIAGIKIKFKKLVWIKNTHHVITWKQNDKLMVRLVGTNNFYINLGSNSEVGLTSSTREWSIRASDQVFILFVFIIENNPHVLW